MRGRMLLLRMRLVILVQMFRGGSLGREFYGMICAQRVLMTGGWRLLLLCIAGRIGVRVRRVLSRVLWIPCGFG